ncbi:hypothetical protein Tco_1235286 [Tanacetum coccineum]
MGFVILLEMELNTTKEKNRDAIIHVYAAKGISRVTTVDFTTARVTKVSTVVLGYYYFPLSLMPPSLKAVNTGKIIVGFKRLQDILRVTAAQVYISAVKHNLVLLLQLLNDTTAGRIMLTEMRSKTYQRRDKD